MSGGARPTISEVGQGAAALAVLLAAVLALRTLGEVGGPLFSLGFLVIAGAVAGRAAAFIGLPRLTGYLVAGIASGPQGGGILSPEDVKALSLVNALALALIALQAGAELTLGSLRRIWRSVMWSSTAQAVIVVPLMAGLFYALRPRIAFTAGLDTGAVGAIAVVWGVLSLTRSPAVTLAILSETKAKGPVAEHALGVVVLLDVLILPLFAGAMAVARGRLAGADFEAEVFLHLAHELFASVCAGATFGLVIAVLLRVITRERVLMVIVVGYAVTALSTLLRYDTLLVFVVAGFVVMNLTRFGQELVHTSEQTSAGVMIVFFATAGAKLDLLALKDLWVVALVFFVARAATTVIACRVGHTLARDEPVVTRLGFTALVSQAGVTIGLASIVGDALPNIGRQLATLAIAVVGLNELAGPVIFTWGLKRAGELGRQRGSQPEESANADPARPDVGHATSPPR